MEISRPWDGKTIGDAGPYTSDQWSSIFRAMAGNIDNAGIMLVPNTDNFGITVNTNNVTIGVGQAMVYGRYYSNNAEVSLSFSTPSADRYDRVVLRASWLDNKVRLAYKEGSAGLGIGGRPGLTQLAGSIWEIPLWTVLVTTTTQSVAADDRVLWQIATPVLIDELVTADGEWIVSGLPSSCGMIKIILDISVLDPSSITLTINGLGSGYNFRFNGIDYTGQSFFVVGDIITNYYNSYEITLYPMVVTGKVFYRCQGIQDDLEEDLIHGLLDGVDPGNLSITIHPNISINFLVGSRIRVYAYA